MFRQCLTKLSRPWPSPCKSKLSRYLSTPQARPFASSPTRPIVYYFRFPPPKGPPPRPENRTDTGLKIAAALFGFGTVYYVYHLEQVPETGRWRFINISPKLEARMSEEAARETVEEYRDMILPANHVLSRHVRRVASRILAASNMGVVRGAEGGGGWDFGSESGAELSEGVVGEWKVKEWDVMVVNAPKMVNAQVVPGLITIYSGILPVCQDENGLAAVIAHEIGHVVARHTAERMSAHMVLLALSVLFNATLGIDFGVSGLVHKYVLELPNSRKQELEADTIGLNLMARACFDPRAAPDMFVRLGRVEEKIASKVGPEFLQTHPSSASRVQKLEQKLPDAFAVVAANPDCQALQEQLQLLMTAAAGLGGDGVGEEIFD